MSREINDTMSRSYDVPDDLDESDLMAELDGLEDDMTLGESETTGTPSYLQVGLSMCTRVCACVCVEGVLVAQ
jgi:charged multivesicular body protein 5